MRPAMTILLTPLRHGIVLCMFADFLGQTPDQPHSAVLSRLTSVAHLGAVLDLEAFLDAFVDACVDVFVDAFCDAFGNAFGDALGNVFVNV